MLQEADNAEWYNIVTTITKKTATRTGIETLHCFCPVIYFKFNALWPILQLQTINDHAVSSILITW